MLFRRERLLQLERSGGRRLNGSLLQTGPSVTLVNSSDSLVDELVMDRESVVALELD